MVRYSFAVSLIAIAALTSACNRFAETQERVISESYREAPGAVAFDIVPIDREKGTSQWAATYTASRRTARFRIEFGPERIIEAKGKNDFSFSTGKGRFVSDPDSDSSVLIAELKKALEATKLPKRVKKTASLPFTFVNIGEHLSQAEDGGFNVDPPGNWKAIKLFIGEGKQECQVFVNLNPTIRKGQFSIKDPEYGNMVLAELARVL